MKKSCDIKALEFCVQPINLNNKNGVELIKSWRQNHVASLSFKIEKNNSIVLFVEEKKLSFLWSYTIFGLI